MLDFKSHLWTFFSHIGHFVLVSILLDLMKETSAKPGSDVRVVVVGIYKAFISRTPLLSIILTTGRFSGSYHAEEILRVFPRAFRS